VKRKKKVWLYWGKIFLSGGGGGGFFGGGCRGRDQKGNAAGGVRVFTRSTEILCAWEEGFEWIVWRHWVEGTGGGGGGLRGGSLDHVVVARGSLSSVEAGSSLVSIGEEKNSFFLVKRCNQREKNER